ncbi:hypothetical protein PSTG_06345 [Puccinia striiformis f. sp. tritici PST-78]|uniref:Riboflavin kinase n=1 Tax=Puccinia striiformis f. sp. tritici PST-78 TaxID=1165861 RepID=A0A0L0VMD6_9BASI|nr:hypothetical protein PSTG_06345 [Puccinia striiformis f. sp. tritici PST-78]
MSSLASRAPTSTTGHNPPPPPQTKPDQQSEPRPTIIGPDTGPEPPFPIKVFGKVEHGFKRGSKELGCPTANLPAHLTAHPGLQQNGVYYGWASVWITSQTLSPVVMPMVMSVGFNPVYGNQARTIEVHVIHTFDEDFYDEIVKVIVTGFIRPEYNYTSKEALIQDIEIDKTAALQSLDRLTYHSLSEDGFLSTRE